MCRKVQPSQQASMLSKPNPGLKALGTLQRNSKKWTSKPGPAKYVAKSKTLLKNLRNTCVKSTRNSNTSVVSVRSCIRPRMVFTSISFIIPLVSATYVRNMIRHSCFFPNTGNIQMSIRTHVKSKFPCCKTACDKYYGSTRAWNYCDQHHKIKTLKCTLQEKKGWPKCSVTCNSKQSMDIHVWGTHCDGWDTFCGKHFDWLAVKTKHEKKLPHAKVLKKECKEMISGKGNINLSVTFPHITLWTVKISFFCTLCSYIMSPV